MNQELPPFFHEIFVPSLPRLGPGDDASTIRALDLLFSERRQQSDAPDLTRIRILDIGCGNGPQTIQLAKYTGDAILAVDNYQPYLDEMVRRAEAEGISKNINPHLGDMHALGMEPGSFDLIWAEGCLFVMGFINGLETCRELLAPHGMFAASELSWLRDDPPRECREYFDATYPDITGIEANLASIRRSGFEIIGYFVQPESAWWIPFYHPLEERLRALRAQHAGVADRIALIEAMESEIDIYRRFSDYYSNVFYIMQRR